MGPDRCFAISASRVVVATNSSATTTLASLFLFSSSSSTRSPCSAATPAALVSQSTAATCCCVQPPIRTGALTLTSGVHQDALLLSHPCAPWRSTAFSSSPSRLSCRYASSASFRGQWFARGDGVSAATAPILSRTAGSSTRCRTKRPGSRSSRSSGFNVSRRTPFLKGVQPSLRCCHVYGSPTAARKRRTRIRVAATASNGVAAHLPPSPPPSRSSASPGATPTGDAGAKGGGGARKGVVDGGAGVGGGREEGVKGGEIDGAGGGTGDGGFTGVLREVPEGDLDVVLSTLEDRFGAEMRGLGSATSSSSSSGSSSSSSSSSDSAAAAAAVKANAHALLSVGAKRGQIVRLFRAQPELIYRDVGAAAADMAVLLASFRITPPAMLKGIAQSVDWLGTPASHAHAVLQFLDRDLGVNNLARVISVSPHVLTQSVETLEDTAAFLRTELRLGADVGMALERNPALLGGIGGRVVADGEVSGAEVVAAGAGLGFGRSDVSAKLEALRRLLKLRRAIDVLPLVEHFPPLLLAPAGTAEATYAQLEALLGAHSAALVAAARPQVLALPAQAVREPIVQLIRRFEGKEAAAAVIAAANPSLLRRKWDKTAGKIEYITGVMGRGLGEIAEWPAVLSCNLSGRIKRRYEALSGMGGGRGETLRAMLGCSDRVFERRFRVVLPAPVKGKRGRKPKSAVALS
ncbi:hypothetical protein CLOM_g16906 [Closterium sp. NIES-68]|nr:hypothetical protein CLOM_g16906 [Closterium sp. NIES-68]GJP81470.1 hypothetical protein CLOP_g11614 [Closterium sp. NIES-67]